MSTTKNKEKKPNIATAFTPASAAPDFPAIDKRILKFWQEKQIFKKTTDRNEGKESFVFYDGPPGTNGKPHIGHIMQSALKDLWPRYKTMQGKYIIRKAGWDTHGLPVELTAEAELGISGKKDIETFGVEKFINYCRDTVLRFRSDWVETITKLGRFADFENDYLTMSNDFIQSDWWVMQQIFKKGLVYKDFKILPYCCRCGTGLSSHEVAQGYIDVKDLTITAKFPLVGEEKTFVAAWTTTPWTLLGNVALCVGGELQYVKVHDIDKDEYVILAKEAFERNQKSFSKNTKIVAEFSGKELVGKKYLPLWDFSKQSSESSQKGEKAHEIIADEFVTTEDGTGVVHLAFFGEDDFRLIKANNFYRNQHVLADGNFTKSCGEYSGRFFKQEGLDVEIVKDLAQKGLLFDKYRHDHAYPHCWRCKTPLMYYARSSWFLKTTAIKDVMISENQKINWQPPHIKDGRFGKWLENNIDWAVSRERYWGSPINLWSNENNPADLICPASIKELQELGAYFEDSGNPITDEIDLHIHVVDKVVFKNKKGEFFRREKGVLDCWYNAGSMPWGQFGYPAKEGSKEIFETQFPADFICEAIDQTRGWFYTLLAVSCLVCEKSSFKTVICTDHILDAGGKKMSKSLGNVIAPSPLIDKYGADAVRWTFYVGDPWQVKRYSEEIPKESLRAIFIPLWNCYSFFVTYANLDKWTPINGLKTGKSPSELDRWILSALSQMIEEVTDALENYDVSVASTSISNFIDLMSNWYIRRSRRRFWKTEDDQDKQFAYSTLFQVLNTLVKVLSPFAPFVTEEMYQNLNSFFKDDIDSGKVAESVHLTDWPSHNEFERELALEEEVNVIQEAVGLARSLRVANNIKVRQPLSKLVFTPKDAKLAERLKRHIEPLMEEVNVKEVVIAGDSAEFVQKIVKPNWKVLGPKLGDAIKVASKLIQEFGAEQISKLEAKQPVEIVLPESNKKFEITFEDVAIEHLSKEGTISQAGKYVTLALTTDLTPELITEGDAREIVSVIQRHRKELGLEISDFIEVKLAGNDKIDKALEQFGDYIKRECLVKGELAKLIEVDKPHGIEFDINGEKMVGVVRKM